MTGYLPLGQHSNPYPENGDPLFNMSGPSPGEPSSSTLLRTLRLSLHPDTFVFLTFQSADSTPPQTLSEQMTFQEAEGLTVITTSQSAKENHFSPTFPCRMITCDVHSSLEAVGFMAAICKRLTERGIGVNPVSGFFHDHLFVPEGKEAEAMVALQQLAKEAALVERSNELAH